ncbi:MAG: RNA polymerase sigma-54 factor [Gemmobacter sp.]|nr:RNA polymerase sigma-54 factor [Gemmobacter sp.]
MARLAPRMDLRLTQRLRLTPELRQSLDVLRMSNRDLARFLQEAALQNPWIDLGAAALPASVPASGSSAGGSSARRSRGSEGGSGEGASAVDLASNPDPGLFAHVSGQIEAAFSPGPARDLAYVFAEFLEPSGWLGTDTLRIAADTGYPVAMVEAVLVRLQEFEPTGLFARSLAECLRLQADEAGLLDGAMQAVLARLDWLARGDLDAIARAAKVPVQEVVAAARALRGFDPKPGARFAPDWVVAGPPDLIVERDDAGWQVTVNRAGLPSIGLRQGAVAGDPALVAAQRLAGMVQRRNATLLRIASEIVVRQTAALDAGRGQMLSLRRAEIAQALGLHESTVSRALAGLRMATPHGVWRLDDFFPAALAGDVSAARARERVRRLIAAEDQASPLTDAALTELLAAEGIELSRRTVAKYREAMRLPIASRRRR